ncbi:MAG: hypothetical protein HQ559_09505 [Lentisphaerae bacterium]|nr:hypothetical protein [Lentisphaerota bacterium]
MSGFNIRIARPCFLAGVLVSVICQSASADVRLPRVFSDNMVLQRDKPIPVWGWADPGERVAVSLGRTRKRVAANANGEWRIFLPRQKAGGPRTLTVAGATGSVSFSNVLVGEVWLCSGQSNMAWPLGHVVNGVEEVAAATDPKIRVLSVPHKVSHKPLADLDNGGWQVCTSNVSRGVSAVAYFFARDLRRELQVPVGLLQTAVGGTIIEAWMPPEGYAAVPSLAGSDRLSEAAVRAPPAAGQPSRLYNAMVHPLAPYGIRGFLWYQGESNSGDGLKYTDKMKGLIDGWRTVWSERDLPFYFVQICPYRYQGQSLQFLWMAQSKVLSTVRNTGMAVTTDVGDLLDIHPRRKEEVGHRLALWALARTYGRRRIIHSGPTYRSKKTEGNKIRIRFDHARGGLFSSDGNSPGTFEIAGQDLDFVPARTAIDGRSVLVWSDNVAEPREVRFGWTPTPATNWVNRAGIPAMPFRTDDRGVEVSFALSRSLRLDDVIVPADTNAVLVRGVVVNQFPSEVSFRYQWRATDTSWRMSPADGELRIMGGDATEFVCLATLDRAKPRPLPVLALRAAPESGLEGQVTCQLSAWFQRLVRAGVAGRAGTRHVESGFVDPQTGVPVARDTSFRVTYDTRALFVSVTAGEPGIGNIRTKVHSRDGSVWTDDSIELFVLPGTNRGGRYYHFIVNSAGVKYDGAGGPGCGMFGNVKWNGDWEVSSRTDTNSFTVDFVIPYQALGVAAPAPGDSWYINVCRNRQPQGPGEKLELSSWSQTGGIYHTPSRFAALVFE